MWRWLRRKPAHASAPDPADTLRAKLDESRAAKGRPSVDLFSQEELDPDARRRSVHERARARLDDLHDT